MKNISKFGQFAKSHLSSVEFKTSYEDDASQVFHTSLDSTRHLLRWTVGTHNQAGTSFAFHAGFVEIFSPNAFADRFDGEHYFGLHSALFVSISEFAMFCFAQGDFFAEMGNSGAEISPEPWDDRVPGLWLLDHTKQGGHVELAHSRRLIPTDTERYHLSTCLTFLMARFVWLHELSHCFNGHVDLVQDRDIAFRLYEVAPMQAVKPKIQKLNDKDIQRLLQHLEHDADQSAFWGSVNIQLGKLENIQTIINMPEEQRMKLVLFASYAMPWLFEQYQAYMETGTSKTHPEPVRRLEYLFETAKTRLLSQHSELASINAEVLQQFDVVREKIPSLYQAKQLRELFARASMQDQQDDFDTLHSDVLEQLRDYQFSAKSSV